MSKKCDCCGEEGDTLQDLRPRNSEFVADKYGYAIGDTKYLEFIYFKSCHKCFKKSDLKWWTLKLRKERKG